jgi:hypothetical protein
VPVYAIDRRRNLMCGEHGSGLSVPAVEIN